MDIAVEELAFNQAELMRVFRVTATYSIPQNMNILQEVMAELLDQTAAVNNALLEVYDPVLGFAEELEDILEEDIPEQEPEEQDLDMHMDAMNFLFDDGAVGPPTP